eukprot:gnl/Trimastix_PCT/728.p1 GENE.gnl/Trimastix_PCT/728~~gnl/Trimastix_PCT/728.p1  ORF type:complete len:454 (-),score=116.79 gnl/Trimastix_PCT/728:317-1588(-)
MKIPCNLGGMVRVEKLVGGGAFGKVYRAIDNAGQVVAVKEIKKSRIPVSQTRSEEQTECALHEAVAMLRMNPHPNVVKLLSLFNDLKAWYIIMEYCENGELFEYIQQGVRQDVALVYFRQLISAVDFMHTNNICHRDLKLENILVDNAYNLKLCDFGLSKELYVENQVNVMQTMCGSPAYVAPEVFTFQGYEGTKADIWSCGVILFAMISSCLPIEDSAREGDPLYDRILRKRFDYPPWDTLIAGDLKDFMIRILDPDPERRMTIAEIKEHPWYQGSSLQPCRTRDLMPYMLGQREQYELENGPLIVQDYAVVEDDSHGTLPPYAQEGLLKTAISRTLGSNEMYETAVAQVAQFFQDNDCEVFIDDEKPWHFKARLKARPLCLEINFYRKPGPVPSMVVEWVRTKGPVHLARPLIRDMKTFLQ